MQRKNWSKDKISFEIKRRAKEGLGLSSRQAREDDYPLYMACVRYFGSWKKALTTVGFEYKERTTRRWDKGKVISAIKKRDKKGLPLNGSAVHKANACLYQTGKNLFGTWKKAVEASGLKYISREGTRWTKDKIIKKIKGLKKRKVPLNWANISKNHNTLYLAACRYFGSWNKGLRDANIDPGSVRKNRVWSEDKIKKEIGKLYEKRGKLNVYFLEKENARLLAAGMRYFGSWRNAVNSAGFDYDKFIITK